VYENPDPKKQDIDDIIFKSQIPASDAPEAREKLERKSSQEVAAIRAAFDEKQNGRDRPMPREDLVRARNTKDGIIAFIENWLFGEEVSQRLLKPGFKRDGPTVWEMARCWSGTLEEFYHAVQKEWRIPSLRDAIKFADRFLKQPFLAQRDSPIFAKQSIQVFELIEAWVIQSLPVNESLVSRVAAMCAIQSLARARELTSEVHSRIIALRTPGAE